MSWLAKNYEKAALGGAVVVALGLAYLGWSKLSGVDGEFSSNPAEPGAGKVAVVGADAIPKALQSLKLDRSWTPVKDGEWQVDLFTGVPLFINRNDPGKTVDLRKDEPVHPPIPNTWWLENNIDPGYADSPTRDPDADGFSNLDEFKAKTDPNNRKSIPAIIAKLMFQRQESKTWSLRPGFGDQGKFGFSYAEVQGRVWVEKTKLKAGEMAGPGDMLFAEEPAKDRFKVLGSELRQIVNPRTNAPTEVTIVRIEDQRPNKKGDIYEFPAPLSEERRNEFAQNDRTAVFSLEALGNEGKEFKVEERTAFALPQDSDKKDYFLKKVSDNSVTVEGPGPGGERVTVEIPKGQTPKIGE
jgi:hypothetical protein